MTKLFDNILSNIQLCLNIISSLVVIILPFYFDIVIGTMIFPLTQTQEQLLQHHQIPIFNIGFAKRWGL